MLSGVMTRDEIERALERVGRQDDADIDLAEAALLLAARDRPGAALDDYRDHLAALAAITRRVADGARDLAARIAAINAAVFETHGYRGDAVSYDDLQNANLMAVIDRRKGLPVAISILYIHCARAQGWPIDGLNFPAHFLVCLRGDDGHAIVDAFRGGQMRSADELQRLIEAYLGEGAELAPEHCMPVGNRDVLIRLQNNIKIRALRSGDAVRAEASLASMTLFAPDAAMAHCELADLDVRRGALKGAVERLERFVAGCGDPTQRHIAEGVLGRMRRHLH